MTPRAQSLSFLLHTEPFDLHFHKWKRNLSLRMILWLPCNWPTGKFGSLSYKSCKCLHISLSDIKAVTIIYVTTRLIRKHFQVLGIWAQRDGHSSFNAWTLLQTSSWLWCWGQNPRTSYARPSSPWAQLLIWNLKIPHWQQIQKQKNAFFEKIRLFCSFSGDNDATWKQQAGSLAVHTRVPLILQSTGGGVLCG